MTAASPDKRPRMHPNFGVVAGDSIVAAFICSPECFVCDGEGVVCENHPATRWRDGDGCDCGAEGMPCPNIRPAAKGRIEEETA